jgi:inhibitor of KinA
VNANPAVQIHPLGDSALIAEWRGLGPSESIGLSQWLATELALAKISGVREAVAGLSSLAVYFDPIRTDTMILSEFLTRRISRSARRRPAAGNRFELPACYDDSYALDRERVSRHTGLRIEEFVRLHAATEYMVHMIGFMPGFCYLAGLPAELHVPRLPVPRERVASGSLGIGGEHAGIYPLDTPGGWNVIGRCPTVLFRPESNPPSLMAPGDVVRFIPISKAEFTALETTR